MRQRDFQRSSGVSTEKQPEQGKRTGGEAGIGDQQMNFLCADFADEDLPVYSLKSRSSG